MLGSCLRIAAVLSVCALSAPTLVEAAAVQKSIVISSGADANSDGRDDAVVLLANGSEQPAVLLTSVPGAYAAPLSGSRWIGPPGSLPANNTARFKATFVLPENFSRASTFFEVHADNYSTIWLNGTLVGAQTRAEILANFQAPAESFTAAAGVRAGINEVLIDLYNYSGPAGVNFRIRVDYAVQLAELKTPDPRAQLIADQYIVVFKDAVSDTASRAQRLAAASGATLLRTYDSAAGVKGFAAVIPPAGLDVVRLDAGVSWISQDQLGRVHATQTNASWGLDRVDQLSLPLSSTYRYGTTGQGVTAYVIDSGIVTHHPQFEGRAFTARDFVGDGNQDCHGHGTHVAGIIGSAKYGVAKKVRLGSVRILDCGGTAPMSKFIEGVNWVTDHGVRPAVVNISGGGLRDDALDLAVQKSIDRGFTYVVSAGNFDTDACAYSPARAPNAITVGATQLAPSRAEDQRWLRFAGDGSNYGNCVDLFAPGADIPSVAIFDPNYPVYGSGTSMAAPFVAGAAALHLQRFPSDPASYVTRALLTHAVSGILSSDSIPNRMLYVGFLYPISVYISGPTWSAGGPPVRLTAVANPAGNYYYTWIEERCTRSACWTITSVPKLNGTTIDLFAPAEWRSSTVRVRISNTSGGPVLAEAVWFVDGPAT